MPLSYVLLSLPGPLGQLHGEKLPLGQHSRELPGSYSENFMINNLLGIMIGPKGNSDNIYWDNIISIRQFLTLQYLS